MYLRSRLVLCCKAKGLLRELPSRSLTVSAVPSVLPYLGTFRYLIHHAFVSLKVLSSQSTVHTLAPRLSAASLVIITFCPPGTRYFTATRLRDPEASLEPYLITATYRSSQFHRNVPLLPFYRDARRLDIDTVATGSKD